MYDLIKVSKDGKQVVSARDLHETLGSKQDFSNWIKNRIEKCGLIDGIDYQAFNKFIVCKNGIGGSNRIEYAITISAAKELSMVEGNEKGKQVRKYFIECERIAKESAQVFQIPKTYAEALQLAANQAQTIEEQERQLEEQKPKALFADAVTASDRCCLVAKLAKVLQQNGYSIGQNRLFEWMRNNGYLGKKGEYYNLPTQKAMKLGLFEIKKTYIMKSDGTVLVTTTTKVTGRGQLYFVNKFLGED